jgi:hypothetical protein
LREGLRAELRPYQRAGVDRLRLLVGLGLGACLADDMGLGKTVQERVLVFTQFRELCAPLANFLSGVFGSEGLILHGGTAVKARARLVEQFRPPDGPPFFVL